MSAEDMELTIAASGYAELTSAIRAVLDLHKRVSMFGFMDHCAECVEFDDADPEMSDAATRVVWPCPTVLAVEAVLGGAS